MQTGKELRMRRFFRKGNALIIPLDHALYSYPVKGIEDAKELIKTISETEADGILLTPGILEKVTDVVGDLGIILRIDGTHTRLGKHLERIDLITTVENALSLGADMVVVNTFVGVDNEDILLKKLGYVATECRKFGMPLLAEMIPVSSLNYHYGKEEKTEDKEQINKDIALVSRLGAEIGADCIKTHYTEDKEGFGEIVKSTPVPIVIAGGPKGKGSDEEFLSMIKETISAGARGICIGRNVWQRTDPKKIITALCQVVHKRKGGK